MNPNDMPKPNLLPQFGVDPELQRILNAWVVDCLSDLANRIPRAAPAILSGCQFRVKSNDGNLHFDLQVGEAKKSPILAVAEMPKNLPPINGNKPR